MIRSGVGKVVLCNAVAGIVPEPVRQRIRKIGFATPERAWFRTVCLPWITDTIHSRSFRERGHVDVDRVAQHLDNFLRGQLVSAGTIWRWVNLKLWLRQCCQGQGMP